MAITKENDYVVLQYGQASVRVKHYPDHDIIHADWVGVHSLVSIQKAMNELLNWFSETGSAKYLSDNSNIVGGWDTANDWLAEKWTPNAVSSGLRYVAHVMAPGIYGQLSMEALQPRLENQLTIRLFDKVEEAEAWLKATKI